MGQDTDTTTNAHVLQALHSARQQLPPLVYQPATITSGYEDQVRSVAAGILSACEADADAALASTLIDNALPYTANHAFNAAIVCAVFAARQDCASDELAALVCAALTMNLSIAALLDSMATGSTAITPLQKLSIEQHHKLSNKTLSDKKIKNRDWLNAVMQHHERADGTGPLRMPGDAMTKLAHCLTTVDRYCAWLAVKGTRPAAGPEEILKHVARNEAELQAALDQIKSVLGPYHPGIFVKLANEEIAVVLRNGADPQHPTVAALGRAGALSLDQCHERNTLEQEFSIVETLDLRLSYNKIKLCRLWGCPELTNAELAPAA